MTGRREIPADAHVAHAIDLTRMADRLVSEDFEDREGAKLFHRRARWCGVALYAGHPRYDDEFLYQRDLNAGCTLYWTDYVVNDWAEWYPSTAEAFMRLAALVECGVFDDDNNPGFFRTDPETFARLAGDFLADHVDR